MGLSALLRIIPFCTVRKVTTDRASNTLFNCPLTELKAWVEANGRRDIAEICSELIRLGFEDVKSVEKAIDDIDVRNFQKGRIDYILLDKMARIPFKSDLGLYTCIGIRAKSKLIDLLDAQHEALVLSVVEPNGGQFNISLDLDKAGPRAKATSRVNSSRGAFTSRKLTA